MEPLLSASNWSKVLFKVRTCKKSTEIKSSVGAFFITTCSSSRPQVSMLIQSVLLYTEPEEEPGDEDADERREEAQLSMAG